MSDEVPVVVADFGSHQTRIGRGGEDCPYAVLRSITFPGSGKSCDDALSSVLGDCPISEDEEGFIARDRHDVHPVVDGAVVNWESFEQLAAHVFKVAGVQPEAPVLMSEPMLNTRKCREKMAELMFETFEVPEFCLFPAGALALYSGGRNTGLSLDMGEHSATASVILNDIHPPCCVQKTDFGGYDTTALLLQRLKDDYGYGEDVLGSSLARELETTRNMKQRLLSALATHDATWKYYLLDEQHHTLPDGRTIDVTKSTLHCAHLPFEPSTLGRRDDRTPRSIVDIVVDSVSAYPCEESVYSEEGADPDPLTWPPELFGNVVVSGGNSFFPLIGDRLQKELKQRAPRDHDLIRRGGVMGMLPMRVNAVWDGGSVMANLSSMKLHYKTRAEYDECGPQVVVR